MTVCAHSSRCTGNSGCTRIGSCTRIGCKCSRECPHLSMAVWEIFRLRLITSPWLEINGHVGVGGWRAEFRLRSVSGVGFGLWQRFYDVIRISPGLGAALKIPGKQVSSLVQGVEQQMDWVRLKLRVRSEFRGITRFRAGVGWAR